MKEDRQNYDVRPNHSVRLIITSIAILATVLLVIFKAKVFGEFEWIGW